MRRLALIALVACTHAAAPPPPPQPAPRPAAPVKQQTAWLGVLFEPKTTRVKQVIGNGPAEAAGVHAGDEITAVDGTPVTTSAAIIQRVARAGVGSKLSLAIKRADTDVALDVKLEARPGIDEMTRGALLDKPAPPFTASWLDGGTVHLADLRGNVVLVEFWATWCGPCSMQFPDLARWHTRYAAKGLHIIALTAEEPALVREFVTAEKLAYPIALDADDAIRATYLAAALPTSILIDRAGVVRLVEVGVADPAVVEPAISRLLSSSPATDRPRSGH